MCQPFVNIAPRENHLNGLREVAMAGTFTARKHLSADALIALLRSRFEKIADPRSGKPIISLADSLMSAYAMFALKDPSLLAFDERRNDDNFHALFKIDRIPSDTQMREILDP